MPIEITMPSLSPTMEEGNLSKWLVKEGDRVAPGDVIAEIETDKATMEVEAIDEGVVTAIVVPAGTQGVKINTVIAILAGEGEAAGAQAKTKAAVPPTKAEISAALAKTEPAATPSAKLETAAAIAAGKDAARTFASPLARRMAGQAGIDLLAIAGSGPRGRIIRVDVDAAIAGGLSAAPVAGGAVTLPSPSSVKTMADDVVLNLFEPGSYKLVAHDSMRKTIARRLVEAKSTIPHFYLTVDCRIDALLALRRQLNEAAPMSATDGGEAPAFKLSVNDMIIKAMAMALMAVPEANATWTDSAMMMHDHADIGVAVSIPGGLITPIIRKADQKTLSAIANEMKDLAARARARKLKPEEYQGGTTAISNLGMYGIRDFSAVINPPHATILAVGAGEERVVVEGGEMKIANVMTVTLSTDHRAVDGALGAQLLGAFKRSIENPMMMLV